MIQEVNSVMVCSEGGEILYEVGSTDSMGKDIVSITIDISEKMVEVEKEDCVITYVGVPFFFIVKHGDEQSDYVSFIANTRKCIRKKGIINYREIVELALCKTIEPNEDLYTVTYSNGPQDDEQGMLHIGGLIKVAPGMVFNVTRTDNA